MRRNATMAVLSKVKDIRESAVMENGRVLMKVYQETVMPGYGDFEPFYAVIENDKVITAVNRILDGEDVSVEFLEGLLFAAKKDMTLFVDTREGYKSALCALQNGRGVTRVEYQDTVDEVEELPAAKSRQKGTVIRLSDRRR